MCEAGDSHHGGDQGAGDQGAGQLSVFFNELFNHDFGIAQQGLLGGDTAQDSLPTGNVGTDGSITFGPSTQDTKMAFILNDLRNGKSPGAKAAADKIFANV
ncbi:MAG: hypothetical protein K2Z81_27650 [Cyanobacteria bacterium]|nr:hypothetical protein [Cyanobacteriota bacterium]